MDTDRGPLVDFGAHFCPDDPPADLADHEFIAEQQGASLYDDIDALRERYDAAGVDRATLSREDVIGVADVERVRRENDAMLETARDHPDVYTLAAVPTAAGGERAAAELRRCIEAGHNGGVIRTKSEGIELHHEAVEPILETAAELGAPLLVHPKVHESLHPDALDDEWHLNAIFGREVAVCESLFKVVHGGVLDRHPDLNLVFHHLGGNIASMLGRIRGDLREGRRPGTDGLKPYDAFREQLAERVYVDTSGFYGDPAAFRATLEAFSASNLLFATDFPYETRTAADFDAIVSTVRDLCSPAEARAVLGGNAQSLLVNT
jgi:predicted TIM-barrel fold metal-dependent hydrolase